MFSAVIDSNVIIAGMLTKYFNSSNMRVVDAILNGLFQFVTSEECLRELAVVLKLPMALQKHAMRTAEIDALCASFKLLGRCFEDERRIPYSLARDITDAKFLDLALTSDADFLVTNDRRHLLPLKKIGRTKIVTPHKFLCALNRAR